jgi:hypothetical protein
MGWITEFHDYNNSRDDMSIAHRVAADLKHEGSGIFRELERVFIDRGPCWFGAFLHLFNVSGLGFVRSPTFNRRGEVETDHEGSSSRDSLEMMPVRCHKQRLT